VRADDAARDLDEVVDGLDQRRLAGVRVDVEDEDFAGKNSNEVLDETKKVRKGITLVDQKEFFLWRN